MNQKDLDKIQKILQEHSNMAELNQFVVSNKEKSIIGTSALAVCDGIVFYDRNNKWGMVGHAVDSYKIELLSEMLKSLPNDKEQVIEYAIIPGYDNVVNGNLGDVNKMDNYLKNNCPPNIKLFPLQTDSLGIQLSQNYAYEFAFDVDSGMSVSEWFFVKNDNKKHNLR